MVLVALRREDSVVVSIAGFAYRQLLLVAFVPFGGDSSILLLASRLLGCLMACLCTWVLEWANQLDRRVHQTVQIDEIALIEVGIETHLFLIVLIQEAHISGQVILIK